MSEVKKRKIPTPDHKAKIGLEAIRGVKTINQLRRNVRTVAVNERLHGVSVLIPESMYPTIDGLRIQKTVFDPASDNRPLWGALSAGLPCYMSDKNNFVAAEYLYHRLTKLHPEKIEFNLLSICTGVKRTKCLTAILAGEALVS